MNTYPTRLLPSSFAAQLPLGIVLGLALAVGGTACKPRAEQEGAALKQVGEGRDVVAMQAHGPLDLVAGQGAEVARATEQCGVIYAAQAVTRRGTQRGWSDDLNVSLTLDGRALPRLARSDFTPVRPEELTGFFTPFESGFGSAVVATSATDLSGMTVNLWCRPRTTDDSTTTFYFGTRQVGAGQSVDIPLENRRLDTLVNEYSGRYEVPLVTAAAIAANRRVDMGNRADVDRYVEKNDEGAPMYLDGFSVQGSSSRDGRWRQVDRPRFVDANEVDNWHDLNLQADGFRLTFDFFNSSRRALSQNAAYYRQHYRINTLEDTNRRVAVRSVVATYAAPTGLTVREHRFSRAAPNSAGEPLATDALTYRRASCSTGAFQRIPLEIPASERIYRIEVRWGDAKERDANGVYIPGGANGTVRLNGYTLRTFDRGNLVTDWRRVAMVETEVFDNLGGVHPDAGLERHALEVGMGCDDGRVYAVRVFSR